jgi:outer membrane protein TolC
MEVMQQQGLILPVDIEKIKINKISLSSNMLSIENTEKKLQQYLGILVGMPEKSTFDLEEDQILASQTIVDLSTTKRPELALLEAQKELNAEELRGTKMAYLPNLSFYASYNYNYNIMPEKDFRTGIPSSFIGLHLDWNLFDGLEKRNKIKINGYNREKLENQEIQLKSQLQLATENARRDIDLQMENLRLNEEQLVLANQIYQTTLAQFKAGTVSTSELLDTDNRKQLAESNVIGAYLQLRLAEIAYLKSLSQIK